MFFVYHCQSYPWTGNALEDVKSKGELKQTRVFVRLSNVLGHWRAEGRLQCLAQLQKKKRKKNKEMKKNKTFTFPFASPVQL